MRGHTLSQRKKGIRIPMWHMGNPHLEAGGPGVKTLGEQQGWVGG